MFIDTHAHLNFKKYGDEIPEIIERANQVGVGAIINVGSNFATSNKTIEIVEKFERSRVILSNNEGSHQNRVSSQAQNDNNSKKLKSYDLQSAIYASVGCHPIHLVKDIVEEATFDKKVYKFRTKQEIFDYEKYKKLAQSSDKVVAIGETGMDYFRIIQNNQDTKNNNQTNSNIQIKNTKQIQKEVFEEHIKLAQELNLPLILHCRGSENNPYDAYDEMLEVIRKWCHPEQQRRILFNRDSSDLPQNDKISGVIHCFGGNFAQAKEFIKLGFHIGFTGIVTFKNAVEIQEVARQIPLDKILIETDCPFLAPVPYRGKRNEPAYVVEIARKIAELKNVSLEEVEKVTTQNAVKLFNLY